MIRRRFSLPDADRTFGMIQLLEWPSDIESNLPADNVNPIPREAFSSCNKLMNYK
jgi:hypothetical protein